MANAFLIQERWKSIRKKKPKKTQKFPAKYSLAWIKPFLARPPNSHISLPINVAIKKKTQKQKQKKNPTALCHMCVFLPHRLSVVVLRFFFVAECVRVYVDWNSGRFQDDMHKESERTGGKKKLCDNGRAEKPKREECHSQCVWEAVNESKAVWLISKSTSFSISTTYLQVSAVGLVGSHTHTLTNR